jgi:ABC-type transport system substrate-binding protein
MRIGIAAPVKGTQETGANSVVRNLTGEPWLTNLTNGRQGERIATVWKWDAAATTLRLTLRKDVYFHDGERLTPQIAAQVLRTYVKDPARYGSSFSSVTAIDPSGEDAVEIKLSEPNSFLLSDLSSVLVSRRAAPDKPEIGTGSFQLVSRNEQDAVLAAFPRYYRGRPGIDGIEILNYPTQRKAWTALMRGEIDMLHEVSREAADFVDAETTVRTYSFPRPYYIPLVFNVGHPFLKRVEIRKAINEALNKEALVKEGLNARGRPADSPIWPLHWAYSASTEQFLFDPDAARRRLDAAGVKGTTSAAGAITPRFSFTCLIFAEDSRFDRLAVLVQKQLADIGVDMKLEPVDILNLGKRVAAGDFDAFLFEMGGRSLSRVYDFWKTRDGSMMNSGYKSSDAAFEKIRTSRTDDETRAAVAELERVLHADPPAAFLVWQATSRAVSTKFDVEAEDNRDIFVNVWQWRPAGAPKQASR